MFKRFVSCLLCIAAVLSLAALSSFADEPQPTMIPDKSMTYDLYTSKLGLVRTLDSATEFPFDYDVPEGGVALVTFFTGDGSNAPSGQFFDELTETSWAKNSKINIYAVDCSRSSAATVRSFMNQHDTNHVVKNVYCMSSTAPNNERIIHIWYLSLIAHNGNMDEVYSISGSYGAVFLMIVTKENGVKHIRYTLSGQRSTHYLQNFINKFTDTGAASIPLITLTAHGNLHYEFVTPVTDIVNRERKAEGVAALTTSAELTKLAMIRAIETSVYWSHTRPDGTSCFTITVNGEGYSGLFLAENIAAVHSSPEKVMENLMNSPGHRANILKSDFNQIGVGCYESAGVYYWVQLFGRGNDTTKIKCSLHPGEVPFARTLKDVELPVSVYQDLVGFLMFGNELTQTSATTVAGKKTDISLPFVYARSTFNNNTLISAFEPYITSRDENGEPYVVPPTGEKDTELGVTVVSDRSVYTPRPANGVISISPYKGSYQSIALPLTVVLGEEGLPDDHDMPIGDPDDKDDPPGGDGGHGGDTGLLGDVNGDGKVNAKDVTTLMKALIGNPPANYVEAAADLNGDGKRNARDVTVLMKILIG